MSRDTPTFPRPGDVLERDVPDVLRCLLCAPEHPWSTAVIRGHWPGGKPLDELWRADSVAPEGDGFVVMFDGGATVLTVSRPRGVVVEHRTGSVSLRIARVGSAVLEGPRGPRGPSFEMRDGVARLLETGLPVPWARGRHPVGRRLVGRTPTPMLEIVALI